jgi:sugar lactone lactonase YvrE
VLAGGDWLVVDASYNGIIRRDRPTGTLSDFCRFSPIGQVEAVPTGIAFDGTDFYVGTLTGLPVPQGAAKVFRVTSGGAQSEFKGGFTAIVDLAISPIDGSLYVLQHARFAGGWADGTGSLLRVRGGLVDTLLVGMRRPSGMAFTSDGTLFVSSYSQDNIVKVTGLNTVVEPAPSAVDFGPVFTSVSDTLSIRIRNLDTLARSVTGITAPGSAYSIVNPPALPLVIAGRASVELRVAFRPDVVGQFPDSLVVATDDPARASFTVPLSGSGATITATAEPGVMYTVKLGTPSGQVNTLDTQTGAATTLATFGLDRVEALAVQRGTGAMYGSLTSATGTALYRIDPASGSVALVRRLPVANMTAFAFGTGDTLYAGTPAGSLLVFDLAADTYTQRGPTSGVPYYSFARSPATGDLWASARSVPDTSDTLYRIDPATGLVTRVGRTGVSLRSSLAFDSTGTLYGLSGGSNTFNTLMTIDMQSGAGTMIGSEIYQNLCAIAVRVDGVVTGVDDPVRSIPGSFSLGQNYPNPFNPETQIGFQIPESGHVTLSVYDMLGREVAVLVNEPRAAGSYSVQFKAGSLASGAYVYMLRAGGQTLTRKLALVK